jgi:hypothetical protein
MGLPCSTVDGQPVGKPYDKAHNAAHAFEHGVDWHSIKG